MAKRVMKYNPAFLSPAELIDQFVVRQDDLQRVLQVVRENTTDANRHVLVIGPRGSGKTMLVRRVAAEINREAELRDRWYPLVFSEESYQVTTPGEFWLEATFHLGQQTKDPRWQAKYDQYGSQWQDEDAMRERALGQLMAFADQQGKRLLLIVESFNTLLGDQISADDAWTLRHTLQNEPRVMLLATATGRFEEIDQPNKAMYELFRVQHLRPLDRDECRVLWQALTGQLLEGDRVRPVQILTGGNVRLLTILSTFGARLSLGQLMADLVGLVDEHTEYFKSHLDALPAVERKVYLALAELWDPSTAHVVAAAARLDVNRTSSLLRRLVDRGAVATLDEPGRTKWYQVAERMYNVYYLFRRRGSPAERVRAVVHFMIGFYQPEQLVTAARHIADEVPGLEPSQRQDHYQVYFDLLNQVSVDSLRHELVEVARDRFSSLDDVPDALAQMIRAGRRAAEMPAKAKEAAVRALEEESSHRWHSRLAEAEQACRKALAIDPKFALAWYRLGTLLHVDLSRPEEAGHAYRNAVAIDPRYTRAWLSLGMLLEDELCRFEEAERAYRKALEIEPEDAAPWVRLGLLHARLSRAKEAEEAFRKAVDLESKKEFPGVLIAFLFHFYPDRREHLLQFAETAVAQLPDNPSVSGLCAWALFELGERPMLERALPWAQRAVEIDGHNGFYCRTLASIQCALGNAEEALKPAQKYLADQDSVRGSVDRATDLFVELAARGEAPRALQVLLDSPSRHQIEPLVVGIRIFLGEDVKVAAEIKEIGLDVARRIEQRRDALRTA